MRIKKRTGALTVRAITGTHVVFLAFDLPKAEAQGLMGFAIQRTDVERGETIWLRGNKTFAETRPLDAQDEVRSIEHPFQAFQWADYAVTPGKKYQYAVTALYGKPIDLRHGQTTLVAVQTELADDGVHGVYFNRGAIASQEYARRFRGQPPRKVGQAAYNWLARDLLTGLLQFIGRAKSSAFSLHVAIYELSDPATQPLVVLRDAKERGAKVHLVYHAKPGDKQTTENESLLKKHGLLAQAIARQNVSLMHNKFIVLSKNGKPQAVWTGSTNWSENAFFGQLNVGHAITNPSVAQAFIAYWEELATDPVIKDVRDWATRENPIPPSVPMGPMEPMFSPRSGSAMMTWWKQLADSQQPLFMTFAFGPGKDFTEVFDQNDGVLRFALMDKFGNGSSKAAAEIALTQIRAYPNIGLSVAPSGKATYVDRFDGWRREAVGIGMHVNWVHTKFMLVDPLGDAPTTVTGSANWSLQSVNTNDENMVAILGDKRVADIYFCEFMRLFAHYRFREAVGWHLEKKKADPTLPDWRPKDLEVDSRKWVSAHYQAGSEKDLRRRYFVG